MMFLNNVQNIQNFSLRILIEKLLSMKSDYFNFDSFFINDILEE